MLRQGGRLFWSELSGTCVSSSGIFVLGLAATSGVVGAYAAVEKLIRAIMSVYLPIAQVLLPRAASLLTSMRLAATARRRLKWLTLAIFVAATSGASLISAYAEPVLALAFGPNLAGYGGLRFS